MDTSDGTWIHPQRQEVSSGRGTFSWQEPRTDGLGSWGGAECTYPWQHGAGMGPLPVGGGGGPPRGLPVPPPPPPARQGPEALRLVVFL